MALELTSDCGLDGTKRITCKGNADREEIRKQLTCAISSEDFDDKVGSSKFSPSESPITVTSDSSEFVYTEDTSGEFRTHRSWASTSITVDGYEMSTRHRRETENTDASANYRKSDVTEPVQASQASTRVYDDVEVTTTNAKENLSFTSESEYNMTNLQSMKPSNFIEIDVTQQYFHTQQDDTTMVANDNTLSEVKLDVQSEVSTEDVAEYPSVINQGQLFSIIENGTMFDIIELNDTAIEDTKRTKIPVVTATRDNTSKNPDTLSTLPVSSTQSENKNSFTTVVYLKEPPPDSTQVTNKSPKKFDQQFKTKYYKKSDPKKINYQSEKDQRKRKEEKYNTQNENQAEIDRGLNKEVEMFPVIASGGPLVKLNRTHRKELPVIDENEKDFFDLNNENPDFTSDIDEDNKLGFIEQHKHIEIKLGKKDDSNASDIFIVTTKFIDEHLGKKNTTHNESTTTFSENHNETFHDKLKTTQDVFQKSPTTVTTSTSTETDINKLMFKNTATDIVIDSKLDDLNRNVSQNNESELLLTLSEVEKADNTDNTPWEKDEIMSKSLLGEIETITDDVIENNTSELKNPTSEPLNSEPITPGRPNRRRKLSNSQRRSFYPYFFSRVLG
ncbi:hypothetical protein WA026_022853 [Henosepilachna vigintioctopunctata]|uniref:Uncharacterized protein n=1 Tax=Henosepilachna vigintioctopunctata TaxID=420089 RepID=A0AAW1U4E5_9CUCU